MTLRPLGYDPDWYDNGPGSENFKRRIREDQKKFNKILAEEKTIFIPKEIKLKKEDWKDLYLTLKDFKKRVLQRVLTDDKNSRQA